MRLLVIAAISTCFLAGMPLATAQMTGNVDRLKADLHGVNLDRAVAAASALGSLKDGAALDALIGALQLGGPPRLISAIVEAVGMQKSKVAVSLLERSFGNRDAKIRMSVLDALGQMAGSRTEKILKKALGDSNPMVRARAARIIGERKQRNAERSLFKMLVKGDKSAAAPLGMVAGAETAKNLAELLGEVPDSVLATAFGEMLKRKNFGPDSLRTEIVKTLGKIPGGDATVALVEYISSIPEKEIRLSKKEAQKLLRGRKK